VVTIRTTCFNMSKNCIVPTLYLQVLYNSQNKKKDLFVLYFPFVSCEEELDYIYTHIYAHTHTHTHTHTHAEIKFSFQYLTASSLRSINTKSELGKKPSWLLSLYFSEKLRNVTRNLGNGRLSLGRDRTPNLLADN